MGREPANHSLPRMDLTFASSADQCSVQKFDEALGVSLKMNKAQRLQTGESAMTHAMLLTAVNLDADGKPTRWRVENSWGEEPGEKG